MKIINWEEGLYKITGHPQSDDEFGFDVYQRYLNNLLKYVLTKYPTPNDLILAVKQNAQNLKQNNTLDLNYIQRMLIIAWNTEFLLFYNDKTKDTELLRVNNQWKPIQSYYSVYSLAEATLYCIDKKVGNHTQCLKKISEIFSENSSFKKLTPWSFSFIGYKGNFKQKGTIRPVNFPDNITIPNSLKENELKPIESIACCLKAEHNNRIYEWKKPKNTNVFKYLHDPSYTTIFHFLYRLRIKSNYKNAELFMVEAPEIKIKSFSDCLSFVVYVTNLVLENIIISKIGMASFETIVNKFNNSNAPIFLRMNKYKEFIN